MARTPFENLFPTGAVVRVAAGTPKPTELVQGAAKKAGLDLAAVAPLDAPHDDVLSLHPEESADSDAWEPFAQALSAARGVRVVFVFLFDEEAGEEGFWRFEGGKLQETRRQSFNDDAELKALRKKAQTRLRDVHAHVWRKWPLSQVARELELPGRLSIVTPRYAELHIDTEWPSDVGEALVQLPALYVPREMQQDLLTVARAKGGSVSRAALDVLAPLSREALVKLAENRRLSSTDKRQLTLYLPEATVELLQSVAVEADTSLSHVFQQAWTHRRK